jgi:hypothetical protein
MALIPSIPFVLLVSALITGSLSMHHRIRIVMGPTNIHDVLHLRTFGVSGIGTESQMINDKIRCQPQVDW